MQQPRFIGGDMHDGGGALEYEADSLFVVEVEVAHNPKSVSQWRTQKRVPCRSSYKREGWQREPQPPGTRAFAQEDIEDEILHGRIELLLDNPAEPVHLVHEEDVALLKVGDKSRQITGALDGRTRRHLDIDTEFGSDYVGESCLAEARRAVKDGVVKGLAALARGSNRYAKVFLDLGLADELLQTLRTQAELGVCILDHRLP